MDDKVKRLKGELKLLKNDVQTIKSQESSRAQL